MCSAARSAHTCAEILITFPVLGALRGFTGSALVCVFQCSLARWFPAGPLARSLLCSVLAGAIPRRALAGALAVRAARACALIQTALVHAAMTWAATTWAAMTWAAMTCGDVIRSARARAMLVNAGLLLATLVRAAIVQATLVRAAMVQATLVRAAMVQATLVRAAIVQATLVRAAIVQATLVRAAIVQATVVRTAIIQATPVGGVIAAAFTTAASGRPFPRPVPRRGIGRRQIFPPAWMTGSTPSPRRPEPVRRGPLRWMCAIRGARMIGVTCSIHGAGVVAAITVPVCVGATVRAAAA